MIDKTHIASCIVTDQFGRILLLHRAADDISGWELPGDTVQKDEQPETAAVRGLHMQLTAVVQAIKKLGSAEYDLDDGEYVCHWFQVRTAANDEPLHTEDFDDADYFELDDLPSLSLAPDVQLLLEKIMEGEVVLQAV